MPVRIRLAPPILLLLLAPMVAEYLLGDFAVTNLAPLPVMALLYGSGCVLVREAVRRTGGGWACFLMLALAYGLVEEGLATQSLFNPGYMHQRLLDYGFLAAPGTALPWLIYVLGLHVIWSLAVPIGLTESLFADHGDKRWLGPRGLAVFGVLYLAGLALIAAYGARQGGLTASPVQIGVVLALVAGLVGTALLRRPPRLSGGRGAGPVRATAPPAMTLAVCFILGSLHLLAYAMGRETLHWPWPATVAAMGLADAALLAWIAFAARDGAWRAADGWAAAMGGLLAYAWFGYLVLKALGHQGDLVGHSLLVGGLLAIGAFAGWRAVRVGRQLAPDVS